MGRYKANTRVGGTSRPSISIKNDPHSIIVRAIFLAVLKPNHYGKAAFEEIGFV